MNEVFTKQRIRAGAIVLALAFACLLPTFLHSSTPIKAAIIGGCFTLVTAIGGVFVVSYQLRKQGENTIKANRENEAMKLKKEVYAEVLTIIKEAIDAETNLATFVRTFESKVKVARHQAEKRSHFSIPSERVPQLFKLSHEAQSKATAVIFFTENWEIMEPKIDLFRIAMNAAQHDMRQAMMDYQKVAFAFMQIDLKDETPPWSPLNFDMEWLAAESEKILDTVNIMGSYIHDFRVEAQSILLGEMFERRAVTRREPVNPKYKVIRLDRYDELMAYFQTTPWGLHHKEINAQVRKELSTP